MCFAIPFQVFLAIFEFYAVLLEEGIGFQPGLDLQQLAKLGGCNLAFAICIEDQRFERALGYILTGRGKSREEFVRKGNRNVSHCVPTGCAESRCIPMNPKYNID